MKEHSSLVTDAIRAIQVEAEQPADAYSWLNKVHKVLNNESCGEVVRVIANRLAGLFPDADIMIFISVISYDLDQENVRNLADQELAFLVNDPERRRALIGKELLATHTSMPT